MLRVRYVVWWMDVLPRTEELLAHKIPDTAGSLAMIVGMLVLFFIF